MNNDKLSPRARLKTFMSDVLRSDLLKCTVKMYCLSIDIPGKHLTQVFLSHLPIFANNVSLNLYEPIEFGYKTKTEIIFGLFQGMMKSSLLLLSQVFRNLSSPTTSSVHYLSATKT